MGGLDVLVNNAGVFKPHPITETTYEEWQRAWQQTLAVNLVGAANVTLVRGTAHGQRVVVVGASSTSHRGARSGASLASPHTERARPG